MRPRKSARRVPLVLRAAEGRDLDRARKTPRRIGGPMKRDAHAVSILLVAIDHEQRPLPIRTLQRVRGDEVVARTVANIGLRGIDLMLSAARLRPLQVDELRHEELRQRLLNLV